MHSGCVLQRRTCRPAFPGEAARNLGGVASHVLSLSCNYQNLFHSVHMQWLELIQELQICIACTPSSYNCKGSGVSGGWLKLRFYHLYPLISIIAGKDLCCHGTLCNWCHNPIWHQSGDLLCSISSSCPTTQWSWQVSNASWFLTFFFIPQIYQRLQDERTFLVSWFTWRPSTPDGSYVQILSIKTADVWKSI